MAESAYIYNGKQGSIEVTRGAFGYNVIVTRNDGEWDGQRHTTTACVGDFSKAGLEEISTKLQAFVASI
jgi:hypothetical protein